MTNFPSHHYELENSADLYPLVSFLYSEIIKRIEEDDEKPLIVLLGEEHRTPSHVLTQIALLEYLAAHFSTEIGDGKTPILFGEEISYHHKAISCLGLSGDLEKVSDPYFFDKMRDLDKFEHTLAITNATVSKSPGCPLSRQMKLASLLSNGIPMASLDAYTQDEDLIAYDNLAVQIAHDIFGVDLSKTLLKASPNYTPDNDTRGITVRNAVKIARIKEKMHAFGAKVMILPVGLSHLYGNNLSGQSYKNALIPALKKEGFRTLGVTLTGAATQEIIFSIIPDEAYRDNPDDVLFEGVIDTGIKDFVAYGYSDEEMAESEAEGVFGKDQEAGFIEMLVQEYSGEECPFNFAPEFLSRADAEKEAKALYEAAVSALSPEERLDYLVG